VEKIDSVSPLVGNWKITSTTCDGQDQIEWSGITLNISAITKDSLQFVMSGTPNDTVWDKSGKLKVVDQNKITRNDGIGMNYDLKQSQLLTQFNIQLKSKQIPCDFSPARPCLPWFRGSFVFTFNRD
jgi:hypothetical protein